MAESKDEDVNLERPKVPTDDKTSRDDDNTYDQIPPLLRTHADGESTERNQTLDRVDIVEKISNMPNTDDCPRPTSNAPIKLKGENIRRSFDYSSHSDSELSKKTNVGKEVSELDEIDENVNRRSQLKNDPTNSYDNSKPTSNDSPFPPNLPTRDYHKAFTSEDRNILQKEINVKKLGEKINEFKSKTKEFIDKFASTKDEDRTAEEIFIITHLLNNSDPKSPILDGQLDQLAMLACCDSSRVVKRALDVLLNEIFLNISDLSVDRCKNVLEAEEVLRSTFFHFIDVDRYKAKCHRMTTYAWLITLVLLKFGQKEFAELQQKMKQFDQRLSTLMKQKEKNEQSLYRYGICLAKESIKKILQSSSKRDVAEFLKHNIKKCENLVKDKLDKDEVKKLGEEFSDADSWLNIHVCLVFLQDLPKHYHFQDNPRPVILIQMLVADYRGRFSTSKIKNFFRNQRPGWQFELLVYRVMLRLIRTSNNKAIVQQVLTGEQGCRGVFRNWEEDKSTTSPLRQLTVKLSEQLCERAVFISTPQSIKEFLVDRCIEDLSLIQLSSTYRDSVLEIFHESQIQLSAYRVNTYDASMSGRKCLLKLHLHSRKELLEIESGVAPLQEEIEILKILNAVQKPCENIVRLLGSSIEAPIHMIIERTPKGDLWTYLHDLTNPPLVDELIRISQGVCEAMIFLGDNCIIHRDLCARSCFVFNKDPQGNMLVKLGDFHLAILSYSRLESCAVSSSVNEYPENEFAVRWSAVEALRDGEFSPASDVWSFGVLLFEIFTFGSRPYVNMPSGMSLHRDEEVRKYVLNGNKLELHPKIPDSIRKIIQSTMKKKDHRPTFRHLKSDFMDLTFHQEIYKEPAHYQKLHRSPSKIVLPKDLQVRRSNSGSE